MTSVKKRLTRSSTDRILAGVLGGIGEYFDISSTRVRILFAIFSMIFAGTLVLGYIAAIFIIPKNRDGASF